MTDQQKPQLHSSHLAEKHWEYIESVLRIHEEAENIIAKVGFHYKTAFLHGFKHGVESTKGRFKDVVS